MSPIGRAAAGDGSLPIRTALAAEIAAEEALLGEFERFAGQCIAVRNHRVCAFAASSEDVCAAVRGQSGVTLLEIPLEPYAIYPR